MIGQTLTTLAATVPLTAGWSAHTWWMHRRLEAARRDPLTGLHTRTAFTRRAVRMLRSGPALVVLADVNDFKATNDVYGHAAGDVVLVALASRLSLACRDGIAARLGGDEFAAVLPGRSDRASVQLRALRAAVCQPVAFDGFSLPLSVSLGAAALDSPHRGDTAEALSRALRRADEAMYTAKRTDGRTHTLAVSADVPLFASVNGRRAGRSGTHQPNGGIR